MSDIESTNWSETAASNNASPPDGWPEGMLPSGVNNAAREMMGALKRDWNREHTTIASSGSANAYVLTYTTAPASYINGQRFSFRANFSCTGSATANVNSLGAKTINKQTSSGFVALSSGDIVSTQHVMLEYDSTADKLILLNPQAGSAGATPGGSTNDAQYNAGGGTLGGATLAAGQPLIGVTSAAPAGGTVLGVYGGGLVLVEQHTASSSATLDFTTGITSTYDAYLLVITDIVPQTDSTDMWIRFGTGGGPTWQTSSYRYATGFNKSSSGTWNVANISTSASQLVAFSGGLGTNSGISYNAQFTIFNPNSAKNKVLTGTYCSYFDGPDITNGIFTGGWDSTTAVTGIRLLSSSGNLTSGTARLYGIAKA